MHIMWIIFELIFPLCHIIVSKNSDTMTIVVTFFGQHYFHNVALRYASVNIMKIMLTKKVTLLYKMLRCKTKFYIVMWYPLYKSRQKRLLIYILEHSWSNRNTSCSWKKTNSDTNIFCKSKTRHGKTIIFLGFFER